MSAVANIQRQAPSSGSRDRTKQPDTGAGERADGLESKGAEDEFAARRLGIFSEMITWAVG